MTERRAAADAPFLTFLTCAACVVMTLGYWMSGRDGPRWGALPAEAVWSGNYGTLLTSTFVHGDWIHLAFNLLWLWRLGGLVEATLGRLEWAGFCVAAALVASGVELAVFGDTGIGMSGVVYALFGLAWGARRSVAVFGLVATDDTVRFLLGWIVLTFVLTQAGYMNVANGAHVGGLLFGLAVAWLWVEKPLPASRRAVAAATLAALVALTIVSATWMPWSPRWRAWQQVRSVAE
jgi:GlpG protein